MSDTYSTGNTAALRAILVKARKDQKLSAQAVADMIVRRLHEVYAAHAKPGEPEPPETLTGESVRSYETMRVQPPIDRFAAWAYVLGYRLVVDLDQISNARHTLHVRTPEAVEIAGLVDDMPKSKRRRLLRYLHDEKDDASEADE